ncbi:MAG: histidine phosphatase family protein [Rhodospirillales bacterium]
MFLYLLQHAEAVPEMADPQRSLTPQGREDLERLGDFLAGSRIDVKRVLHSGRFRTKASADILATKLGSTLVEEQKRILPGDSPEWLVDAVGTWTEDTLVVGHQPFIGRFVSRLVLGKESPAVVDLSPGACVCLSQRGATRAWFIAWMLTPALLQR